MAAGKLPEIAEAVTPPHQADENTDELDNIRVSYTVETTKESVEDGNARRQDHAGLVTHLEDDVQRGACGRSGQ